MAIGAEYITFKTLSLQESIRYFQTLRYSEADVRESFPYWVRKFYRSARAFYDFQFRYHQELVEREFVQRYGEDYEKEICKIFRQEKGLDEHAQAEMSWQSSLSDYFRSYAPQLWTKEQCLQSIGDIFQNAEIEGAIAIPLYKFDVLWLNAVISNPSEIQRWLQRLPDAEYLQTEHWQRVRAAMILIRNAVCQEVSCYDRHEPGFSSEAVFHVHHFKRCNRGNERYQDLRLLCEVHYRKLNAEKPVK